MPGQALVNPDPRTKGWSVNGQVNEPHATVFTLKQPVDPSGRLVIVSLSYLNGTAVGHRAVSHFGDGRRSPDSGRSGDAALVTGGEAMSRYFRCEVTAAAMLAAILGACCAEAAEGAAPFGEVCFEDFDYPSAASPGVDDLQGQLWEPAPGKDGKIIAGQRVAWALTKITGPLRLKPAWQSDSVLRLSIESTDAGFGSGTEAGAWNCGTISPGRLPSGRSTGSREAART